LIPDQIGPAALKQRSGAITKVNSELHILTGPHRTGISPGELVFGHVPSPAKRPHIEFSFGAEVGSHQMPEIAQRHLPHSPVFVNITRVWGSPAAGTSSAPLCPASAGARTPVVRIPQVRRSGARGQLRPCRSSPSQSGAASGILITSTNPKRQPKEQPQPPRGTNGMCTFASCFSSKFHH